MKDNENHILAVAVAGIGDLILASKAIRAIKNGAPDKTLHLLTSTEAATLARNYPFVDQVWSLPVRELRTETSQIFGVLKTLLKLREIRFDRAVNLYRVVSRRGALRMGLLFRMFRADEKVGHDSKGFGLFLHRKAEAGIFQNRHFADSMTDIAVLAGGVADDAGIEVFWEKGSEKAVECLFPDKGSSTPLRIGINPGADSPKKRWGPERYAFVADHLAKSLGAQIFVFGGPGEEPIALRIEKAMDRPGLCLAGKLTLDELAYAISRLDLLVTNDSGPMHIAAAVKTPVVAIFGPEEPVYTRPYTSSPDKHRILQVDMPCRPCTGKECKRPSCMERVKQEDVLKACFELLNRAGMGNRG
jgi:ADP-heptose:LPS heptosyltransferase